jgi:hypothetical protein
MATKKSQTIPKVCQENWLQMSPDEKVRFCNLCQKNVFDFSENNNTDSEKIVCLRHATELEEAKKNKLVDKITNLLIKKK